MGDSSSILVITSSRRQKSAPRASNFSEMELMVPWQAVIVRHYPTASSKGGRTPYPLETILRIDLQQQWCTLSDPKLEDALIEVSTMRRFAGIAQITERIPGKTTNLTFRQRLV